MKVFIIDTSMKYQAITPINNPLGGTQSAICYFSMALSQLGNSVFLLNQAETDLTTNVKNLQLVLKNNKLSNKLNEYLTEYKPDIVISQAEPQTLIFSKQILPECQTIFWTQHDTNLVKHKIKIPEIDYYFFVSDWQRLQYVEKFNIPTKKTYVLRNGMSHPVSELIEKPFNDKPTIVYTSAPFRGLHLLVNLIPQLKKEIPDLQVKIFSSLKTYQLTDDFPALQKLYQDIKSLQDVSFTAGVSQTQMAKEIAGAQFMVYPNIFPETSCVSAIEAGSLGMEIITSSLGALPETAIGHTFLDLDTFHTYQTPNEYLNLLPLENVNSDDWKNWKKEIINKINQWRKDKDTPEWKERKEEQKLKYKKNYNYIFRARNFLMFWENRLDAEKLKEAGEKLREKKNYWDATNLLFHALLLNPDSDTFWKWLHTYHLLGADFIPNNMIYLFTPWLKYLLEYKPEYPLSYIHPMVNSWETKQDTGILLAITCLNNKPGKALQLLTEEYQLNDNNLDLIKEITSYFTNMQKGYLWSLRFSQFLMMVDPNNFTLYINSMFHSLMLRDTNNGYNYGEKSYQLITKNASAPYIFDYLNNTILLYLKNSSDVQFYSLLQKSYNLVKTINQNFSFTLIPKRPTLKKIGFVVGDFRFHPVSRLISIICQHLNSQYEKIIYVTQKHDPLFINVVGNTAQVKILSGNQLDSQIREDRIDILIEMMGYTLNSDLIHLLNKPAPVILSYFAFPYMTGLNIIDGILTDPYLLKVKSVIDSPLCSHKYYPLPEVLQTYQPIPKFQLDIIKTRSYPILNKPNQRPIIFGSFNNPFKITYSVLKVWAKILNSVPNSKLVFCYSFFKKPEVQKIISQKMETLNISKKRIEFDYQPFSYFLDKYNYIDIALDPFPYNGGWTTSECLWMSVPLITLEGSSYLARVGGSLLSVTGITELIAKTPEEYIGKAVALANDMAQLKWYHQNIRKNMQNSSHGKPSLFTAQLETTLEKIYQNI